MKERHIFFIASSVCAILNDRKTKTRRAVNFNDRLGRWDESGFLQVQDDTIAKVPWSETEIFRNIKCPYGQPGGRLWVKETWAVPHSEDGRKPTSIVDQSRIHYAATEKRGGLLWRQTMFMPRWASRITLEIVSIRVERLQDISEADAWAEGVNASEVLSIPCANGAIAAYSALWDSINAKSHPTLPHNTSSKRYARVKKWLETHPDTSSWNANPWVWVVEFKRVKP